MVASVLLVASFAVMVAGALVFTNAVEWLGIRLDLGHAAVGSVLAGVATAMPESLIPVVAIIGGRQGDEIAIGAVIGAPFLLATLAMAVSGGAALAYRRRRGSTRLKPDRQATTQDLLVVVCALSLAIAVGLVGAPVLRFAAAVILLAAYALVTWKTITKGRQEGAGAEARLVLQYRQTRPADLVPGPRADPRQPRPADRRRAAVRQQHRASSARARS